jgi:hypothetical protein
MFNFSQQQHEAAAPVPANAEASEIFFGVFFGPVVFIFSGVIMLGICTLLCCICGQIQKKIDQHNLKKAVTEAVRTTRGAFVPVAIPQAIATGPQVFPIIRYI